MDLDWNCDPCNAAFATTAADVASAAAAAVGIGDAICLGEVATATRTGGVSARLLGLEVDKRQPPLALGADCHRTTSTGLGCCGNIAKVPTLVAWLHEEPKGTGGVDARDPSGTGGVDARDLLAEDGAAMLGCGWLGRRSIVAGAAGAAAVLVARLLCGSSTRSPSIGANGLPSCEASSRPSPVRITAT